MNELLDSQSVIDALLEELEAGQKKLATELNAIQDKNKNYIKMEQPVSKIKTEHKPALKSMFHGTTLASSPSASTSVLDTSVLSDSSEGSYDDC